MREVIINPLDENQRVNKFLRKYLNKAPESFIYKMLRKKNIKLNGKRIEGGEILKAGDVLSIYMSEESLANFMEAKEVSESAGSVRVVYEDENILICEKPPGVLSQKEKAEDGDTMVDRIGLYLRNKDEYPAADSAFSPSICNRLDRNTGGLIMCGKNFAATQNLNRLIKEKSIKKFYLALVKGEINEGAQLDGYLIKDADKNIVKIIAAEADNSKKAEPEKTGDGKRIITRYKPLRVGGGYTLLEVELVTGKSHQIRAHLSWAGYPIVGDRKYGDSHVNAYFKKEFSINYQVLYAYKIQFENVTGFFEYLGGFECSASLPGRVEKAINRVFCG